MRVSQFRDVEAARLPVDDFGAEQQAGIVAEVAGHHRRAEIVDVGKRAARDLDPDVHRS